MQTRQRARFGQSTHDKHQLIDDRVDHHEFAWSGHNNTARSGHNTVDSGDAIDRNNIYGNNDLALEYDQFR